MTEWTNDTCGCIIEFDHDPRTDTFTGKKIILDCGKHGRPSSPDAHFRVVLEENQRKNLVLAEIERSAGISPVSGRFSWSYDDSRVLHVKISGLSAEESKKLPRPSKVIVEA